MSKVEWGRVWWYLIWFGLLFLPAELGGEFHKTPWPTLSATIQHDVTQYWWFSVFVLAGVTGLAVHFLFQRHLLPSLVFGLVLASAAHLLDKAWP